MQLLGRLELDDELIVDDHVESLTRQRLAAMVDHHCHLTVDLVAFRHEIALERQAGRNGEPWIKRI